ncbi:hypothetical protein [Paraburkholderia sediminicola]|uniref:hypothetical protein n=1 Tax=Paraburkholderia sediminicola TaxID=458836 RepID=UPI0038BBA6E9
MNPSDYVAQHLQNFAPSSPAPASTSIAAGHHLAIFLWNPYAFVLPVALFVVLVCVAAFRDRWAVFRFAIRMTFGQRLYVWWSCAWRQCLANILLAIIGLMAFLFLYRKAAAPIVKLSAGLIKPGAGMISVMLALAIGAMPIILAALIYMLLSLPFVGYAVQSGLASHALPGPKRFNVSRATLLGLTTFVWSLPGSLMIASVVVPFPDRVADVLRVLLFVVWGMYVVLPRQVRRVARLAEHGR